MRWKLLLAISLNILPAYILLGVKLASVFKGIVHIKYKTIIIYSPSCHCKPVWLSFFPPVEHLIYILIIFICPYNRNRLDTNILPNIFRRRKLYSFVMTWRRVNKRKFIFGWPFSFKYSNHFGLSLYLNIKHSLTFKH